MKAQDAPWLRRDRLDPRPSPDAGQLIRRGISALCDLEVIGVRPPKSQVAVDESPDPGVLAVSMPTDAAAKKPIDTSVVGSRIPCGCVSDSFAAVKVHERGDHQVAIRSIACAQ